MIKPDRIGHVVIKVRDLERSLEFYTRVLGLDIMNKSEVPGVMKVAFLSCGGRDHHELGLLEIGADAPAADAASVGMSHFAFRLKDQESLEAAYADLKANDARVHFTVNHGVANSIYLYDPDGNELEVYADNPPEVFEPMPNAYMGTDKLPFAPNEIGIMEAMQGG